MPLPLILPLTQKHRSKMTPVRLFFWPGSETQIPSISAAGKQIERSRHLNISGRREHGLQQRISPTGTPSADRKLIAVSPHDPDLQRKNRGTSPTVSPSFPTLPALRVRGTDLPGLSASGAGWEAWSIPRPSPWPARPGIAGSCRGSGRGFSPAAGRRRCRSGNAHLP